MMRVCLEGTVCVCLFVYCSMESETSQTEEGFPLSPEKLVVSLSRRANSISSGNLAFYALFFGAELEFMTFFGEKLDV